MLSYRALMWLNDALMSLVKRHQEKAYKRVRYRRARCKTYVQHSLLATWQDLAIVFCAPCACAKEGLPNSFSMPRLVFNNAFVVALKNSRLFIWKPPKEETIPRGELSFD